MEEKKDVNCENSVLGNMEKYKVCAEKGCKFCQNQLGYCYSEMKDYDAAIYWFRKAIDQNLLIAKHNLACNLCNKGLDNEAEYWFKEASKEKYPSSLYCLGVIHERRNSVFALSLYKASAQLGNENAILALKDLGVYDALINTPAILDWLYK